MKSSARALGAGIAALTPAPLRRRAGKPAAYLNMLFVDHVVVRYLFQNRHRLSPVAWRSAQPLPHHFRRLKKLGIKTVICLRGEKDNTTYALEKAACAENGLTLVDYRLRSRAAPSKQEILGAVHLFETVEYPILMHCKSGADRAGLISALYRHVRDGVPVAEAKNELSLRYGHFRSADTGVLDAFFERYLADNAREPIGFLAWVETRYDPEALAASHRAKGWSNRIVNSVLKRE